MPDASTYSVKYRFDGDAWFLKITALISEIYQVKFLSKMNYYFFCRLIAFSKSPILTETEEKSIEKKLILKCKPV